MVNKTSWLIGIYVAVALGTVVVLVAMSVSGSPLATDEAWGHAVIVALFAVLLPLRWRVASRGSGRARRAVLVIALVLLVVNVVEAALPFFPGWMRLEMVAIAVLMALVATVLLRAPRAAPAEPAVAHR